MAEIHNPSAKKAGFLSAERVLCWLWLIGNGIVLEITQVQAMDMLAAKGLFIPL